MSKRCAGVLTRIAGPVVEARMTEQPAMLEQVSVGELQLTGEIVALRHNQATIQVYEETGGLRPGEPIFLSGHPLSVALGPGLLGSIYDGIQRPLRWMNEEAGRYIRRGERAAPLPDRAWHFVPTIAAGAAAHAGVLVGTVDETEQIQHRVLVPPEWQGIFVEVVPEGMYRPDEIIAQIEDATGHWQILTLTQIWPVRRPRPFAVRLAAKVPLITGQRVLDTFFAIAKGGTAAIPGPFGAGKTVIQHSLAKWSDAQIIVYIGCGERGNEMAQVLEDFPKLTDPWSGRPLMERTILIANTSNMPVAAREASIYTGITIAEYYRDQGYDVALIADSTSRWAEALREIAGRMEEMPAEEGFPAYLPSRLAAFYERAGRVCTFSGHEGSVTVIGAVSPPGGDFSEPVTQHSQRFTHCFWMLDRDLASARHFPAVNWLTSYSFYIDSVSDWWSQQGGDDWCDLRQKALALLGEEARLQEIVRLVGADALPDHQRWVLDAAHLLRGGFLQQNALHPIDAYTVPQKQLKLLRFFVDLYELGRDLVAGGVPVLRLRQVLDIPHLLRLKEDTPNTEAGSIDVLGARVREQLLATAVEHRG